MVRTATYPMAMALGLSAGATHIVGGEMFYDHLGGTQYRVVLDLYRDCGSTNTNGTGFDASATIAVYNAAGVLIAQQSIPFNGEQNVPITIPNPCLQAPPNVCISTTRYQAVFNLPPIAGGYHAVYQRCCRTPAIVNLFIPADQGLTCTSQVPPAATATNSSPRFNLYPPVVLCVNEAVQIDHSASDPDGDQLVYSFCTPYHGGQPGNPMPVPPNPPPFTPVPWQPPYSASSPLPSDPPIAIDATTGLLTVKPTQSGIYTVGVCVQEWRNGVLLGETRRDFMFTVVACNANIQAVIAAQAPGTNCSLTQAFGNLSVNGQFWLWNFGDPTTLADTSNAQNPTWTYPAPGSYTVTLIANPGWPCADTSIATYSVSDPIDPGFSGPTALCGAQEVTLQATGNFGAGATVSWNLGPGASPSTAQGPTATAFFAANGSMPVTVTIAQNGCTESHTGTIGVWPVPSPAIAPQSVFCGGLTVSFANQSTGAGSYHWDFGDASTAADTSVAANPTWTYAQPGTYTVTLTADPQGPCTATATQVFLVYSNLDPSFVRPPIRCPGEPAVFAVSGTLFGSGADVTWDFGAAGSPTTATGHTTVASFPAVGTHPVTVFVSENGCNGTFTDSVVVHPFPLPAFTSDTRLCAGSMFGFYNQSEAWTPMSFAWQFGDGSTSTASDPVHQYTSPGLYSVTLTVSTDSGCVATRSLTRPAQVEVLPNPVAAFSALPREVDLFNPRVEVTDHAIGAVDWTYSVDGQWYFQPSFTHEFGDAGQYIITQWVENEFGCRDSTERLVIVSGHLFWAPTAFTPDGNGLNDIWLPVVMGAREYELWIHDRWGRQVFHTVDPREGWNGDGYTQSVFIYTVRIKEWGANAREYTGHFSLLR